MAEHKKRQLSNKADVSIATNREERFYERID